jgi:HlyD family secretion protein
MKKKYIILVILCLVSCKDKEPKKNISNSEIEFQKVRFTESNTEIKALGSVSYLKKAEISSKVLGRIEAIYKEEGERVKINDVLAKVETLNLEIQLSKDKSSELVQSKQVELSKAKLLMAEQRVERDIANIRKAEADVKDAQAVKENLERSAKNKNELMELGAVSETELKSIQTSLNSATVALFKAQKNLENIMIGYRLKDIKNAGISENLENNENLLDKKFIKLNTSIERAEYEMAIANLSAIKKSVESTELLIKESYLKSPLDGIVATRAKDKGESIKESESVFIVVDVSYVLIRFNVSESESVSLFDGQNVKFTVDAIGHDHDFQGKIHIISPIVDPQSRSLEVKVIAENKNYKLKPGMFVRGIFVGKDKNKNAIIPKSAIKISEDKKEGLIFVANEKGLLFNKKVKIVNDIGEGYEVSSDLKEEDIIATSNIDFISEGEKVDIEKILKETN